MIIDLNPLLTRITDSLEIVRKVDDCKVFLKNVFGDDWEEKGFFVNEPNWGKRLHLHDLDHDFGCYWCVGAIPQGLTRKIHNIESVRALVIDDVGTKVAVSDLTALGIGKATAVVCTSEGNYQYVYRLSEPISVEKFNRFRKGLLGNLKGASDGKDAAHLFRLPMGINRKTGRNEFAVAGQT